VNPAGLADDRGGEDREVPDVRADVDDEVGRAQKTREAAHLLGLVAVVVHATLQVLPEIQAHPIPVEGRHHDRRWGSDVRVRPLDDEREPTRDPFGREAQRRDRGASQRGMSIGGHRVKESRLASRAVTRRVRAAAH
jgi:hypothetical protein